MMDANGINHQQNMAMPNMGNQFLNQGLMNGMPNGQHFMPDSSTPVMPMPGAELMMPLMLANGQAQAPTSGISAGMSRPGALNKYT
jgi:hypothetical protein